MGGGCAGVGQLGLAKELWKRNRVPKKIQGVSVGALNGAALVAGGPDYLEKTWLDLEQRSSSFVFNWSKVPLRIFKSSLFSDWGLDFLVSNIDIKAAIDSPIEFEVVVCNESLGRKKEVVSNRDPRFAGDPELFRQFIKASSALPGFFPPVLIGGHWYSDGYRFNLNTMADCDNLFVVLNDKPIPDDVSRWHWAKRLFTGFNYVLNNLIEEEIENFLEHHKAFNRFKIDSPLPFLQRLFESAKDFVGIGPKQLIVISPSYNIPTLGLDTFGRGDITLAIQKSSQQAEDFLNKLDQ
ncbi:MAG: patatin-like phospholipase family protein [Patescibacteria group bacterium]